MAGQQRYFLVALKIKKKKKKKERKNEKRKKLQPLLQLYTFILHIDLHSNMCTFTFDTKMAANLCFTIIVRFFYLFIYYYSVFGVHFR